MTQAERQKRTITEYRLQKFTTVVLRQKISHELSQFGVVGAPSVRFVPPHIQFTLSALWLSGFRQNAFIC